MNSRLNLLVPTPFGCASIAKMLKQIRVELHRIPHLGRPVIFSWSPFDETNTQVLVSTRSANGWVLAIMAQVRLYKGFAVCVFDPEGDGNLSRVLARDRDQHGILFHIIDLNPRPGAQFSIFGAADAEEVKELLISYFSLENKGRESDFYRTQDRAAATRAAKLAAERNISDPRELLEECLRVESIRSASDFMAHLRQFADRIGEMCAHCRNFGPCSLFDDEDSDVVGRL